VDTGQGIVHAVALSADGQLMATGGEGDRFSLKLWHLPDGKLVRTYNYFNGYVRTVAFSPAGAWIIVSDNAAVTHVLDIANDKQLVELKDMYAPLLSPQGDILMTVSKASFTLWSTSDWAKKRTLPRSPAYAIPLALSPEADSFVITSSGILIPPEDEAAISGRIRTRSPIGTHPESFLSKYGAGINSARMIDSSLGFIAWLPQRGNTKAHQFAAPIPWKSIQQTYSCSASSN